MRIKRFLSITGRIIRIAAFVAVAVILLGNIYISVAKNVFNKKNPTFFGFSYSVILTGSMSGEIEPNDIIITRKNKTYSVGDIITYSTESIPVTHRIIAVEGGKYRTKGDANNVSDEYAVKKSDVTGKVILIIPKLGSLFLFIKTPIGMLLLLALVVAIIEIPNIAKHIKSKKTA